MEIKECKACHAIKPINEFTSIPSMRMGMTLPAERAEMNSVNRE